jgi:hypothetical protein
LSSAVFLRRVIPGMGFLLGLNSDLNYIIVKSLGSFFTSKISAINVLLLFLLFAVNIFSKDCIARGLSLIYQKSAIIFEAISI